MKREVDGIITTACFLLSMLCCQWSFAQSASPYSRYGLGDISSTVFSANKAMGGVAAPYTSSININYTNPASYAFLTRTTIELGANFDGTKIIANDSVYRASSAAISHFVVAFVPNPKINNWAITIGLLPYSDINYTFIQNYNDTTAKGIYQEVFSGSGSLYQAFAGGAYRVKGFSIGANAGFLFGKLDYVKTITFPDTVAAYSTSNVTSMNAKSFIYNVGVQYQRRIFHNNNDPDARNDIYVTVGAYGSSGMKMRTKISNYWERFDVVNSVTTIVDTVQGTFNTKGTITLPFNVGGGIMFGNERFWMLGADYKFADWQDYSSPLNNGGLVNSWRVSIGGQITPKYDDARKFLNRVQYRLGGYFGKSEINFAGSNINEAGGTVGLGFPFKAVAHLNVTGDFGNLGGSDKTAIHETYYRFTVGLVLNDIWFIKRKFD